MMEKKKEPEHFKFFSHKNCEFFPCHQVSSRDTFNCLFCYCPLYALGEGCGGRFRYGENGVKDCTDCGTPHSPGGYDYIKERFPEISELAKKKTES